MKKRATLAAGAIAIAFLGCSSIKLSRENYVNLMSDMGCNMVAEQMPQAEPILKKYGVTQADIDEFRKGTKADIMMEAAREIAQRVAACHGVSSH